MALMFMDVVFTLFIVQAIVSTAKSALRDYEQTLVLRAHESVSRLQSYNSRAPKMKRIEAFVHHLLSSIMVGSMIWLILWIWS